MIDRRKAIEAMIKRHDELQNHMCYDLANGVGEGIEVVKSMPSAEKTGKWIVNPKDGRPSGWKCDQCGWIGDSWDHYCRHCGARMVGEEHDCN